MTYTITPKGSNGCYGNPFDLVATINPEPVVTNKLVSTCSDVALNYDLSGLISGSGDTYSYTVISSDSNVPAGSPRTVASASNITDVYTNTTGSPVTITYTITPIGSNGCLGNPFDLVATINQEPVVTSKVVSTCSDVALNYDLSVLVSGSVDTYSYTVISSDSNVPAGSPRTVASAANITDVYTNTTGSDVTITYVITPFNAGCEGTTFNLVATINPEPVVTNKVVSTCSDVALNYDLSVLVSGSGDTYTYTVTTSNSLVAAGSPRTVASASNITDVYTNTTASPVIMTYTITPKGSNGCYGNPFDLVATINPEPVVLDQTITVCSDIATSLVLGSDVDGPSVASYSITNINNGGLVFSAGAPAIGPGLTANELFDDAWTNNTIASVNVVYTVVPLGINGCDGDPFKVTVIVTPEPIVANQISNTCSESQIGLMLGNDIDGPSVTSYNIISIVPNGGLIPFGGSPALGTGLLSNVIFDDAWTNTTNLPLDVVYTIIPVSGLGCEGSSFTFTVTVSPKPIILNQSPVICSGDRFMIAPVNNPATGVIVPGGTTYIWTVINNPDVLGETDQPNPQANISQTLTNFSNQIQVVNYTVIPLSGSCQGTPFTIAVSVNPRPFIPNIPQLTDTRCSGEPFIIIPQNGIPNADTIVPPGTTYTWTVPANNLGATAGSGLSISQVLSNPTNVIQSIIYTLTPSTGTCVGLPFDVKIWIEPKPFIPTVLKTICNQTEFILSPINGLDPTPSTIIPNITKYSWGAPTVTGAVTGWTTGTNALFFNSGTLDNPTPFIQTVTFQVTPSYYVTSNPNVVQCTGDSFEIIVTVNPKVTPNEVITNVLCFNSVPLCAASITLNPIGGAPFDYLWTFIPTTLYPTTINPIVNPIDRDQFNLCPGDYKVEIKDSYNCTYPFTYTIAPPTPITESVVIHQNISCNNINVPPCDGYIQLAISGGTPLTTATVWNYNYIFEWYEVTPLGTPVRLVSNGTPILQNACEGNYRLKVTDANLCVFWTQIHTISKLFVPTSIVETLSNYNNWSISCNGKSTGFVHTVISGGSGSYNYSFVNDANPTVIISGTFGIPRTIPQLDFDNLPAGNYTLTITDTACPFSITRNYTLTQPPALLATVTPIAEILCNGKFATYQVVGSGGTTPYTYLWNPSGETTSSATRLPAAPFDVTVTDSNGCPFTVNGVITQPSLLVPTATITTPISCFGGNAIINISAIGGTPPYTNNTYSGDYGNYTVSAGLHRYIVIDANGCPEPVEITVLEQPLLQATAVITAPIRCNGGFATVMVTAVGGTGLGTYTGTGTFQVRAGTNVLITTVMDANNCPQEVRLNITEPPVLNAIATLGPPISCNRGTTTVTISGTGGTPGYIGTGTYPVGAGTYNYPITDANGCPASIPITVIEPSPVVASAVITSPIKCKGGTATVLVTATGGVLGTSGYTGIGNFTVFAGTHCYTVKDGNNCSSFPVCITVTEPPLLVATAAVTSPVLCNGGSAEVTLTVSGGTPAYTITENGSPSNIIRSILPGSFTIGNVSAGSHTYIVTDVNLCTITTNIPVTQPGPLVFTYSKTDPNCITNRLYDNGSICITITGGTNPFPVGPGWVRSTSPLTPNDWCLSGLSAGNYTIAIADANSCPSSTRTVTLTKPTPLTAFVTSNINVNCPIKNVSQTNIVFASGGVPGYTYSWSGGTPCPGPPNPQCMTTDINATYTANVNDFEGFTFGCIPVQVPVLVNLPVIGNPLMSISSSAMSICGIYSINDPISFTNISTGNFTSIQWSVDGISLGGAPSVSHLFTTVGEHSITLVVNYAIGGVTCTYSITEKIKVTKGYDMVVPNAFTPSNNDGINDTIKPEFNCMKEVEMKVYDTWGSLLYVETGTTLKGWDGTINGRESENGNYIIVIKATTLFGAAIDYNGPFTLLK
jgi:gliding motility-associated-like protein